MVGLGGLEPPTSPLSEVCVILYKYLETMRSYRSFYNVP